MTVGERRTNRAVAVAVGIAVTSGAIGWIVGRAIESPADAAARAKAPNASVVSVPVEKRTLSSNLILRGTIGAVGATEITLPSTQIGSNETVVVKAKAPGDSVAEGDVLAVVGNRPVIVVQGDLPMYRDLTPGTQGEDVLLLENALDRLGYDPGEVDGRYDANTEEAVSAMYSDRDATAIGPTAEQQDQINAAERALSSARAGTDAAAISAAESDLARLVESTGPSVPANELVFASVLPATVSSISVSRGSRVDGVLATLASSEAEVRTSVAEVDREYVRPKMKATVQLSDTGAEFAATVATIADRPGTSGAAENRYAVVLDGDVPADTLGAAVRVTIPVTSTDGEVLVVPAAAVTTDSDGSASVDVVGESGAISRTVTVRTGLSARGLVEVTATSGRLEVGEYVAVSRREANSDDGG